MPSGDAPALGGPDDMEALKVSDPRREVDKPLAMRMLELVRALQLLSDSAAAVRAGRVHHLAVLSGQLRALVCDRRRDAGPLLFQMAEAVGRTLEVYAMPDVDDSALPAAVSDKALLHVSGMPITMCPTLGAQQKMTLAHAVERRVVRYKGQAYSGRTLIERHSNEKGGSHYSLRLPADLAELATLRLVRGGVLENLILQLAEATLASGRGLLRSLVDSELHALVAVPSRPVDDRVFLYDALYEGTHMRVSLCLDRKRLPEVTVVGLQGVGVRVASDRLIDWNAPRYLRVAVRIEDDLRTRVELGVDGQTVGCAYAAEPLLVLADPLDYEVYQNRAADGGEQNFTFAFREVQMYSAELSPADRARLLLHFEGERVSDDGLYILFAPRAYAHAARGTKNMTMYGQVSRQKASRLFAAEGAGGAGVSAAL